MILWPYFQGTPDLQYRCRAKLRYKTRLTGAQVALHSEGDASPNLLPSYTCCAVIVSRRRPTIEKPLLNAYLLPPTS
ncbi:hypothetical protein BST61_g9575 [Cercospora zeina]